MDEPYGSTIVVKAACFLGRNRYCARMSEFDSIRPFHDHEVPQVVERIVNHPELPKAAANIVMPEAFRASGFGAWLASWVVRHKTRHLSSIHDCQMLMARYFKDLITETTHGLSASGIENLDTEKPYLFMSNHRDIVMDSSLLNFLLHQSGHQTCRMAVGDNLLEHELAADLMKLNKSFVVERGISGTRAAYKVLGRTSSYIRQSIEEGASVWIAQKEGRAKDGWDRTDPALLKMLSLAHKSDGSTANNEAALNQMVSQCRLIPVSVGYELDPCACAKAHELRVTDEEGVYTKADEEDVQSIVAGLVGQKGRVHLHFGDRIEGHFSSPQALADAIDRSILGHMRVYPTQVRAARLLGDESTETEAVSEIREVMEIFDVELDQCPEAERGFYLLQYANLIRNRRDCGVS